MKIKRILLPLLATAGLATATVTAAIAAVPSPTAGSLTHHDVSSSYVSGVSAGGYMANQLHVAYSGVFKGAGIFTAGPYDCAQGDVNTAQYACMATYQTRKTPAQLEQETRDRAAQGRLDPVANLSGDPVYLYHGTSDTTVAAAVNDDLATYYRDLGASVTYDTSSSAGHAWVSPLGPVSCSSTASPFINNCGTDPEGAMLGHLFGSVTAPSTSALTGKLIQFDQRSYVSGGNASAISMGNDGFAYVPGSCDAGSSCRLMVALHGCKQSYATIGNAFMDKAYLNEYADTNNVIVLYPQATTATDNPNSCWNWWGYGGDTGYATHGGKQIEAIMSMVRALGGAAPTPTTSPTPSPTASPTASPTPSPTASPTVSPTVSPTTTPTGAPVCATASNYAHTTASRAYQSGGYTYANGSNNAMGLWNTFTTHTLKQTGPNYWVLADGQC
jgi:poly(3-hydroxybutyrate) depolymerase